MGGRKWNDASSVEGEVVGKKGGSGKIEGGKFFPRILSNRIHVWMYRIRRISYLLTRTT